MKKFVAVLMLLGVMFTLAACKIGECDFCGEKGVCKKGDFLGQEGLYCKECLDNFEEINNMIP